MKTVSEVVERTCVDLQKTALKLYEAYGQSAVMEWGDKIGLEFVPCIPCECDTPIIGDIGGGYSCAVCGETRRAV